MANHVVGEEHVCRSQFRKKQKANAAAPDAASKLIWLALRDITADWGCADHTEPRLRNRSPLPQASL